MSQSFNSVRLTLTDREREILRLLADGLSDREIANKIMLTVGTVKWYNRQIYSKLNVRNRVEAVTRAQEANLLADSVPSTQTAPVQHHLPAQLTSFIGRSQQLQEIRQLLRDFRLVTLTGPPGTGKSRLALEVASALADTFQNGAHFVSLASVQDPALVATSIAQALSIRESGGESPFDALTSNLRDKHLLLMLDNFEHVLPAAALVSDLLKASPKLAILATSREALRLYGEAEYPVPPLQLPDLVDTLTVESIQSLEAVELLVQRAQAVFPNFELDHRNANAIASICVHLDGLPLAIELAAARLKYYPPQSLLLRLGSRLEALVDGPRDMPVRQRTLRATLAWSYELLEEEQQVLFSRLGVFAGGCTLEDAEAVCHEGLSMPVDAGMASLLDKNLLHLERLSTGDARYSMLGTMREYALEKLEVRGEIESMREKHARYYLAKTAEAAQATFTIDEYEWLGWLEAQHDNLSAALRWLLAHDRSAQDLMTMIANLSQFWMVRCYFSEGLSWMEQAMALPGARARTIQRADACHGVAVFALWQDDYESARALCEEALSIYEEHDNVRGVVHSLVRLSETLSQSGDFERSEAALQRAYEMVGELETPSVTGNLLCQMGFESMRFGDFSRTQRWLEEGLALFEAAGDLNGIALATSGLGELYIRTDNFDAAQSNLDRSLQIRRELQDKWGIAACLGSIAWIAINQEDYERASVLLLESIDMRLEIGAKGGIAWCLEKFAEIAYVQDDAASAVRILSAATALRESIGSVVDPSDQPHIDDLTANLQDELGTEIFRALWSEGYGMGMERTISYVSESVAV